VIKYLTMIQAMFLSNYSNGISTKRAPSP